MTTDTTATLNIHATLSILLVCQQEKSKLSSQTNSALIPVDEEVFPAKHHFYCFGFF
jgi:hypothetical protein